MVLNTLHVSLSGKKSPYYGVSGKIHKKEPITPAKQSNPIRNLSLGSKLRHSGNNDCKNRAGLNKNCVTEEHSVNSKLIRLCGVWTHPHN